ncbi:MAG: hypothetical protein ACRDUY_07515 [Nitriliruptorales bacterium]
MGAGEEDRADLDQLDRLDLDQLDFGDFEDDEEFLAAWAAAESAAAAVIREALGDLRGENAPEGAISTAAQHLRQAVATGDANAAWMLRAAAMDSQRATATVDGPDDAGMLVEAVAGTISMVDESGLEVSEEAAVLSLELADWAGAVIGLCRRGVGASAEPDHLVDYIDECPEIEGPPLGTDAVQVEMAFEIVLPAWEVAGIVDRDRRLTVAGRWVLPRAVGLAWESDFDLPPDQDDV